MNIISLVLEDVYKKIKTNMIIDAKERLVRRNERLFLAKVQGKWNLREKQGRNSRKKAGKEEFARKVGKEFSQKGRERGICEKKRAGILAKGQGKWNLREK